jgi:hypothetical protein
MNGKTVLFLLLQVKERRQNLFEFTGSGLFNESKGFLNEFKSQKGSDTLTDADGNLERIAASENEKYTPDISLLMQSFKKKAENTDIQALS